jgi:hypothetical protein
MSVTDAEGCSIGIVGISIFPRGKEEEKAQEQHAGYCMRAWRVGTAEVCCVSDDGEGDWLEPSRWGVLLFVGRELA